MNWFIHTALTMGLASVTAMAVAADNACLLEGSLKIGKQVTQIKDCMQNNGVKKEQFLQTCKGIAEMGAGMGAPPKVTYLDACPASPQGVCEGVFGQPIHSYYYMRSVSDLADSKASCQKTGGKWRNG
ncbi:hypothetical protein [Noviherbaspirillum sp.]|uniref:hypothetical protein n=1 Tax=Noviherbaspirillum sp. TaxID=1926288 RepID=UPI002FDFCFBE